VTYGTQEHEDWLIEQERHDAPASEAEIRREEGWDTGAGSLDEDGRALLHWGQRERIGEMVRSAWYDTTTYRVPVNVPITDRAGAELIRKALYTRWATSLTGWSVGGYSTPAVRHTDDPFTVEVDVVYHIGD
jgi:hypothetical protein